MRSENEARLRFKTREWSLTKGDRAKGKGTDVASSGESRVGANWIEADEKEAYGEIL